MIRFDSVMHGALDIMVVVALTDRTMAASTSYL